MSTARELIGPVIELARTYGARGIARRAVHETLLRGRIYDWLERSPVGEPPSARLLPIDHGAAKRVLAAHPEAAARAVARAEEMLKGRYPYFSDVTVEAGWPPRWHHHPKTGRDWRADHHWTGYAHAPLTEGDIKWLWEPSRFHFAWLLPRAWSVTGDRRFADEMWHGLTDWLAHNPWGRGANWYCAQELSFRCFALLFAASVFAPEGLTSSDALRRASELLFVAAHRIDRTLDHSLSQRNNHALSEAMALWTLSHVFDGAPRARSWRARSQRALLECVRDQFAADGAYIQESLNYHRLAIHVLLWGRFVARSFQVPLPGIVEDAIRRSFDLFRDLLPRAGGALPNYGHNDGALLLPLSSSDHRDFRPTLVHMARELDEPAPVPPGPWDEQAAWFGHAATKSAVAPPRPDSLRITSSGYLSSRRGEWLVMSRIPSHGHHRPGQADALHVDVWHGDRNVALDPGSFAYSEPPPWDNALVETRVHNTCSVGARSQMRRRGRFLWTNWTHARLLAQNEQSSTSIWLAEVKCSWGQSFVHTRLVCHRSEQIDVLDAITGDGTIERRLHWNLDGDAWRRDGTTWSDGALMVVLQTHGASVRDVRADPQTVLGWTSPTYGCRVPCTAIEATHTDGATSFQTTFARAGCDLISFPSALLQRWQAGDFIGAAQLLV